jgi:type VI secretion system protein ImpH
MIPSRLAVSERLRDHPYDFSFFQAVRLLALMRPERAPLGSSEHPADEVVRIGVHQSLLFPPSSLYSIRGLPGEAPDDEDAADPPLPGGPPRMRVTFFGLTGVQGILPVHYTEHLIARAGAKDYAMAAFFDLFNHRLLSLYYRAWEKHTFPARYQLAAARRQADGITGHLLSLIGMGTVGLTGRHEVADQAMLRYAGLLAQWPRSAVALQNALADYFDLPVHVQELQGAWYRIEEDDQCDLSGEGLRNQLGLGAVAGDATWDPQAGIRLRLGPMPLMRFLSFLPDADPDSPFGDATIPLREITRLFAGNVVSVDWQPVLEEDEVPRCRLADAPRLGWNTWLNTGDFGRDGDDALFRMA